MRKYYTHTYRYLLRATMLLVISAFGLMCSAQGFSKLYHDGRPSMLFGSVDYNNGTYYTTGVTSRLFPPYYTKSLFAKINEDGILDTTIVLGDTNSYNNENFRNALQRSSDGNYIFVGSMFDSMDIGKAYITKVDTLGNMLLYKEYGIETSDWVKGQDVVEIPKKGYMVLLHVNNTLTPPSSDLVVVRTDTNGNVLSEVRHSLAVKDISWVMKPMFSGNFLIGSANMKASQSTPFWCKTWLLEVDSMGNKVNEWIDNDMKHMWPRSIKQTADSGWIIVRPHLNYDIDGFQAFNACILKLDKNFNKEWEIDTGGIAQDAGIYDIEILPDGDYICSGANPIDISQDSSHIYGWIMKVSKQGEVLWQKTFLPAHSFGTWAYLYDIDILPNGDLIACGEKTGSSPQPLQQAWLLRTDSNGCELENCVVGINDIDPQASINVYPNPFNAVLNISIEHVVLHDAVITVTNPLGQVVYMGNANSMSNNYSLDLHHLSAGIYYISVATNGERVVKSIVKE